MPSMTVRELVDEIGKLNREELADLVGAMEAEFSISIRMPEEDHRWAYRRYESGYKVVLTGCAPECQVRMIKYFHQTYDLRLGEAKKMLKQLPTTIREKCSPQEAMELKKQLEEIGGVIALEHDDYLVYDPYHISPGYAYD